MKTRKNPQLKAGIVLLCLLAALLAGLALHSGIDIGFRLDRRLEGPGSQSLLGTDELGRDLASSLVWATAVSLLIGLSVALLSSLLGTGVGLLAGWAGGLGDSLIMRLADICLSFPGILLPIALVAFWGQGFSRLVLALTISGWMGYARLARGEVLKLKGRDFILAAKGYNASGFRILFHHLLPLLMPLIVVQVCLHLPGVILAESSLNFLGLGMDPSLPTLGQLIDSGRSHILDKPHLVIVPGALLVFLILSLNLLAEGIQNRRKGQL